MKKIYLFLFLSFAAIISLKAQAQQCPAPSNLTASFTADTTPVAVTARWMAIPGGNYRIYYSPTLGLQPYTKDVSNVSSVVLTKEDGNNIAACQSLYMWAAQLDCPTAGAISYLSDTILVSPVVPKFTLIRDTLIAYHWFILDSSTGRTSLAYLWKWGDGDSSAIAAASHTYPSSGYYNICLTLTDAYGCSNTFCDLSFYIYRLEGGNPITVDVVKSIATGISGVSVADKQMAIKQNPCAECEISGIANAGDVIVSDILGRIVQTKFSKTATGYQLQFPGPDGTVFIVKNIKTGQVIKVVKQ